MKRDDIIKFLHDTKIIRENNTYNGTSLRYQMTDEVKHEILNQSKCPTDDFVENLYWFVHDIRQYPKNCKNCNIPMTRWLSWVKSYPGHYCSKKCSGSSNEVKNNRKNNLMEKYGVTNVSQLQSTVDKRKQTNLERFGNVTNLQTADVKESLKNRQDGRTPIDYAHSKHDNTYSKADIIKHLNDNDILSNNEFSTQKYQYHFNPKYLDSLSTLTAKCEGTDAIERIFWLVNTYDDYPKQCMTCVSKIKKWRNWNEPYPNNHCSNSCSQLSTQTREKFKKNNLKKYGVEHLFQSDEFKKKSKETMIKQYRVPYPNQQHLSPEALEILNDKEKFIKYHKEHTREGLIENLKSSYSAIIKKEIEYGIRKKYQSNFELQIEELLKNLKVQNYMKNTRKVIAPKELDYFFPDHKLAIEINGIYYHSELRYGKDQSYHLNKTEKCLENNVKLLHIWDSEMINHWPIVESRIKSQLNLNEKIFARKCQIKPVNYHDERVFFSSTHIQGHSNSKVCYGLYLEDELVSCMSFRKSRFDKNIEWEILRYSSKLNTNVIGGASKLFAYFIKDQAPNSIITYADRRWGEGKFYENLGFQMSHSSKPNYFYTQDYLKLHSRNEFQKHKLKDKLSVFDEELTEWENMTVNAWDRIWDCGNNVYHWKNNQ